MPEVSEPCPLSMSTIMLHEDCEDYRKKTSGKVGKEVLPAEAGTAKVVPDFLSESDEHCYYCSVDTAEDTWLCDFGSLHGESEHYGDNETYHEVQEFVILNCHFFRSLGVRG